MPRIIVDCSHTFQTGAGTGIQRVVRRIADELLALAPEANVEVVPVRLAGGRAFALPLAEGRVAFPRSASARESVEANRRLDEARRFWLRANRVLRSARLARWIDAGPNEPGLSRRVATASGSGAGAEAVEFRAGDAFLCLDSSWVYDIRTALDEAGRAGASRALVLCDVLPLSHPQWFTEGTRRYFRGWLCAVLPRLEGVFAISRTTCASLAALAGTGELPVRALPPCRAIRLGAEIPAGDCGEVRPELKRLLRAPRPPAFLSVGTLEPRKNLDFAIDLFDALAARGLDFQWHLVGAPGWLAEATAQRIRAHPRFGDRLFWWTDLDDAELLHCYRHAAALVAVSRAEGFGLPLVEARLAGLPVFASDIPVFREVLGAEARYLPLDNARLAAAPLEDFLERPRAAPEPTQAARPWKDCARELLGALLETSRAGRGPQG